MPRAHTRLQLIGEWVGLNTLSSPVLIRGSF